ncbi:MerC domain-containing protein [Phenylobacterium sp.]|uniref:MerC domain-containing protein n=1 Tax=Phenylobacterium sp. TaxID=1871053 RepID=UPI002897BEA1|nr:MerC domain-containing protein [Phenylobacterium sp.]
MKAAPSSLLDASAISLSGLCLAHCLALPLVAAFSPVVATWAEAEWVHALAIGLAAPMSALALWRKGQALGVIAMSLAGLALMALGVAHWPSHDAETPITVAGSLLLAGAHVFNWRRRHACRT